MFRTIVLDWGGKVERVILHIDQNNFYASVECLYNPALRNKPVAVGGDVEQRHGIVLAKNMIAKRFGVKTGEALWQAQQKCPILYLSRPTLTVICDSLNWPRNSICNTPIR
jgi:DNA polymerase-4